MREFITEGQVWAAYRAGKITLGRAVREANRLADEIPDLPAESLRAFKAALGMDWTIGHATRAEV